MKVMNKVTGTDYGVVFTGIPSSVEVFPAVRLFACPPRPPLSPSMSVHFTLVIMRMFFCSMYKKGSSISFESKSSNSGGKLKPRETLPSPDKTNLLVRFHWS
jgi:hypothetical protein